MPTVALKKVVGASQMTQYTEIVATNEVLVDCIQNSLLRFRGYRLLDRGFRIGGCEVIRLLGQGGMGQVYLALQLRLQRQVALKVLLQQSPSAAQVERFLREAQRASQIEHPNVVPIYDTGTDGNFCYIVMQYIEGRNLAELVRDQGQPLSWPQALQAIRFAARGLNAVHGRKIIHRDIKPSNIMVSRQGRVLLMDFGLSRNEDRSDLTATGQLLGTPSYMSPEQCLGRQLDRRTDIYSLGGTLYFLLTCRPPFEGSTLDLVGRIGKGDRPRDLRLLNGTVAPGVQELVQRAMAFDPSDRQANVQELLREVDGLLGAVGQHSSDHSERLQVRIGTQLAATSRHPNSPPSYLSGGISATQLLTRLAIGAGIIIGALGSIAIVIASLSGSAGPREDQTSVVVPEPSPAKDLADMVHIEAGWVELGNELETINKLVLAQDGLSADARRQVLIRMLQDEVRRIQVPAFFIDRYEVSNAEYGEFVRATGHQPPSHWAGVNPPLGQEYYPVVNVTYEDALAYADWANKQLPTLAQWVRAARGQTKDLLPWGEHYEATRANLYDNPLVNPAKLTQVKATPDDVSSFGVFNLGGNVSEWTLDRAKVEGHIVPIVKGGCFAKQGLPIALNCCRQYVAPGPGGAFAWLGFRCVVSDHEVEQSE